MGQVSQVVERYTDFVSSRASIVALGNFDGLHRGHQEILSRCLIEARRVNGQSVCFSFHPHPTQFLRPKMGLKLLLTRADKRALMGSLGFDVYLEQVFDEAFSEMSAEDFCVHVLRDRLQAKKLIVGKNFRFGKSAKGDVALLKRLAFFEVDAIDSVERAGEMISSSRIRGLVTSGDVRMASEFLGYPYFLSGRVVHGEGRGRPLGFPTANLETENEILPCDGVYACLVECVSKRKLYLAATNVGTNPTFQSFRRRIESHLLDFKGDLYGEPIRLFFLNRLRDVLKFSGPDELIRQILTDVQRVRGENAALQNLLSAKSLGSGDVSDSWFPGHPFEMIQQSIIHARD